MEKKRLDWADTQEILKFRLIHARSPAPTDTSRSPRVSTNTRIKPCAAFQLSTCEHTTDHGQFRHVCDYCYRARNMTFPHDITPPMPSLVETINHPPKPVPQRAPVARYDVCYKGSPHVPFQTTDHGPTATTVLAQPGEQHVDTCPSATAPVAVPTHPGGPHADTCPTAAASVAVRAHPGGPYADSCPTAAASVAVPAHPGRPYADSYPTAATSVAVPAQPGGPYASEHHADACPTAALSVTDPDHPTEQYTDARPTAAANVHAPARSGGLRADAPPFIPASRTAPARPVELHANTCPTADASISGPSHTTEQHAAASVTAPGHSAEQIADACSPGATTAHTHPTELPGAACPYQQVDANPSFAPVYLRDLYNTVQRTGCYNFMAARKPVPSGLNIASWGKYLADYTDHNLVDMLEFGWPVHFDRSQPLAPVHTNHHTATAYPEHVDHYIRTELGHGTLLGPFAGPPVINLHTSPLMTREKKDSPHRRVIVDLSFPPGFSINDGIPTTHYLDGSLSIYPQYIRWRGASWTWDRGPFFTRPTWPGDTGSCAWTRWIGVSWLSRTRVSITLTSAPLSALGPPR